MFTNSNTGGFDTRLLIRSLDVRDALITFADDVKYEQFKAVLMKPLSGQHPSQLNEQ